MRGRKYPDVITIGLPKGWRDRLEKVARKESFERDKTLTWADLLREAVKEKYNFDSEGGEDNE